MSKPRYSKFVVYLPAEEAQVFLKQLSAEARRKRVTRSEVLRAAFWKTVKDKTKAA